ncbi:MAG TPA: hypothetical protein EYO83_13135 [Gemmatimonadetes bacterium]|nr:hypothetical protein [Gemmatimonadota bacterium]
MFWGSDRARHVHHSIVLEEAYERVAQAAEQADLKQATVMFAGFGQALYGTSLTSLLSSG